MPIGYGAAAQDANKRLVELGYELQSCLLDPTGTDEVLSQTHFQGKNLTASWLVLVLGYCHRIPVFFEKIINTSIRTHHSLQKYASIPILLTLLKRSSVGLIVTLKKSYTEKLTVHLIGYC
jgi:hypothetical protein